MPTWDKLKNHLQSRYAAVARNVDWLELSLPIGAAARAQAVGVGLLAIGGRMRLLVVAEVCPAARCDPEKVVALTAELGERTLIVARSMLLVRRLADPSRTQADTLDGLIEDCANEAVTARIMVEQCRSS